MLSLASESLAMTRILLEHGADVNAADGDNRTALHEAIRTDIPDMVDALVKAGAELEIQTGHWGAIEQGAPLDFATEFEHLECTCVLVRHGASVNAQDVYGRTPLHKMCDFSSHEMFEAADLLLRWGADETITDDDGETAMDLIRSIGGPLHRLLANAPADRAWRRRGMLVMCRAHSDQTRSEGEKGRSDKVPHGEKKINTGAAGACGNEGSGMLARVVGLEDDAIFRTIMPFL